MKVKKEDIAIIVSEMELATPVAERKLREAGGDVVKCLTEMLA